MHYRKTKHPRRDKIYSPARFCLKATLAPNLRHLNYKYSLSVKFTQTKFQTVRRLKQIWPSCFCRAQPQIYKQQKIVRNLSYFRAGPIVGAQNQEQ